MSLPVNETLNFCGEKDYDRYDFFIYQTTNKTERMFTFVITSPSKSNDIFAAVESLSITQVILNSNTLYFQATLNGSKFTKKY